MTPVARCYEIRVAETLDSSWQQWFVGMEIVPACADDASGTLLRGRLPDQPALYGLLARVRDLNLTLLDVHRIEEY